MKTSIAILSSIYWIFFFISPKGIYLEHIFQLIVALILTGFVIYEDIKSSTISKLGDEDE